MKRTIAQRENLVEFNGYLIPDACETHRMPLATRNAHVHDKHIAFRDDTHTYYIKGVCNYISCTTFIGKYFEKFDPEGKIREWLKNKSFPHGRAAHAKYVDLCYDAQGARKPNDCIMDAILQFWDDNRDNAAKLGTEMHNNIEFFYNDLPVDPVVRARPEFGHFKAYHDTLIRGERDWRMLRTEMLVFDPESRVCGSIDAMYVENTLTAQDEQDWRTGEKTITVHLVDWKRSREIRKRAFGQKTGYGPCDVMPCTNYSKYSIQLNIYRTILEKHYNVRVASMELAVFHPNNETFNVFGVTKLDDVVRGMFKDRIDSLERNPNKRACPGANAPTAPTPPTASPSATTPVAKP